MSSEPFEFASHDLVSDEAREAITGGVIYEKRPAKMPDGSVAEVTALFTRENDGQCGRLGQWASARRRGLVRGGNRTLQKQLQQLIPLCR